MIRVAVSPLHNVSRIDKQHICQQWLPCGLHEMYCPWCKQCVIVVNVLQDMFAIPIRQCNNSKTTTRTEAV